MRESLGTILIDERVIPLLRFPLNSRLYTFVGGTVGEWSVVANTAIIGEALTPVTNLGVVNSDITRLPSGASWVLSGVTSNERYVNRSEKIQLVNAQAALGRPTATRGAVIPIRKNAQWWAMTQDERRAVFEETSHHIRIGMQYLPAISRRLHHCRDLGYEAPFDFITYFDYAPANSNAFEDLVAELRATEEWKFVEREVDLRLERG